MSAPNANSSDGGDNSELWQTLARIIQGVDNSLARALTVDDQMEAATNDMIDKWDTLLASLPDLSPEQQVMVTAVKEAIRNLENIQSRWLLQVCEPIDDSVLSSNGDIVQTARDLNVMD